MTLENRLRLPPLERLENRNGNRNRDRKASEATEAVARAE
jgi:hypothetical protein